MARAKRHYIPGHIWHITHRCHKREFLLKFARDRHRWLQWLLEARKRYGLLILNYNVTSNHIHLLVVDDGDNVIAKLLQLIAGRTAQEYNQRKKRNGAFWEDRYHATAVESGEHLLRCLVYIDLNMFRAGIVSHPSEWYSSGSYGEIQQPRRKCRLIAYDRLRTLAGFDTYDAFRTNHKNWVESALTNGNSARDDMWTRSIAVGSKAFVDRTKAALGTQAQGRKVLEGESGFQLRDPAAPYNHNFGIKNSNIEVENRYYCNISIDIST